MHELAVTQSILTIVLDAAQQAEARRVSAIDLVIGDLSSIVDDSVQFYFDLLSADTLAQGATLRFRREPTTITCQGCSQRFGAAIPLPLVCPACGSTQLQVVGGREFLIESIEIDENEGSPEL